jgi:hypothetical protein
VLAMVQTLPDESSVGLCVNLNARWWISLTHKDRESVVLMPSALKTSKLESVNKIAKEGANAIQLMLLLILLCVERRYDVENSINIVLVK